MQAGKLRMSASAAPERGTGPLADVKTWPEQGAPVDYLGYNGAPLPPKAAPEQIRFWEQALRKVSQSPEWIALFERSGNKALFRSHDPRNRS